MIVVTGTVPGNLSGLDADAATAARLLETDPLALGAAADRLRREMHGDVALLVRIRVLPWDGAPSPLDPGPLLPGRTADEPDEVRVEGVPPPDPEGMADHLRAVTAVHPGVAVRALRPAAVVALAAGYGSSPESFARELASAGLSALHHPAEGDPWEETLAGLRAAAAAGLSLDLPLPWDRGTDTPDLSRRIEDVAAIAREAPGARSVVPLPAGGPDVSPLRGTTGLHDLRVFAAARLLLRMVPHVTVEATVVGPKQGAVALSFGADSLAGALAVPTERLRAKDAEKPRPFNGDRARALLAECGRTVVAAAAAP